MSPFIFVFLTSLTGSLLCLALSQAERDLKQQQDHFKAQSDQLADFNRVQMKLFSEHIEQQFMLRR